MNPSWFQRTDATLLCLLLLIACLLMVKVGQLLRNKFVSPDDQETRGGVNSLLGALFGLWGFMLAFTFGSSSTRFESVRNIMIEENNAIRTAIMRTRIFPDSVAQVIRRDLSGYLQSRIDYYEHSSNPALFSKERDNTRLYGNKLWNTTVEVAALPNLTPQATQMFATLTTMYDTASKRDALLSAGIPGPIQYMLFLLAIAISFIGGFTTPVIKQKEWIVILGFVLLACSIIYIIMDLSRPMQGLIRPESSQERLIELQQMIK